MSLAGALEMGSSYLPISAGWQQYIDTCEKMFKSQQLAITCRLQHLAKQALEVGADKRAGDHYLKQLDWKVTGKKNPHPKWYRALTPTGTTEANITTKSRATPLLLRMTWLGYPLYYLGTAYGWCFRVPSSDVGKFDVSAAVDRDDFASIVREIVAKSVSGKSTQEQYLKLV